MISIHTRHKSSSSLSYLITVSRAHLVPTQMLLHTLRRKTDAEIVVVGNLTGAEAATLECYNIRYIDEDNIDYKNRLPKVKWQRKHREFGWYKQQFIRLCIDSFMNTEQVVILDSEVFVLDNWDENRFYSSNGQPRCGFWIPQKRKPDWDYKMYRGAAYLLSFLPECKGIMDYANSNQMKRSITGVAVFSTRNVAKMWQLLEEKTDLHKNLDSLFNKEKELSFAEYVMYALAVEYGLFDDIVPTKLEEGLLGWYDNHTDPDFLKFQRDAMWSMCQKYDTLKTTEEYYKYMNKIANKLGRQLPKALPYWNDPDRELIDHTYDNRKDVTYFKRYQKQLDDHPLRKRFATMYRALELLACENLKNPVILEVGTLRDANKGGGHSTYKFGEFCSRFGGTLHTVDILPEAIAFSKKATRDFQPWIHYHVSDSTKFLKKFDGKVDLLYLDGFDSHQGQENAASKKQLEEIEVALSKLSDKAIVLLDDADLPEGGKVAFSSQFLLDRGFRREINAYQQLYTRGFSKPNLIKRTLGALRRGNQWQ